MDCKLKWLPYMNGRSQVLLTGIIPFATYINVLNLEEKPSILKLTDDTRVTGEALTTITDLRNDKCLST